MSDMKFCGKPGEVAFAKGLENVIIGESKKSYVDGDKGVLLYEGIRIEELAEKSSFEEVSYLLLYDRLPTHRELADFKEKLSLWREIPDDVYECISRHAKNPSVHTMSVLRTAVSLLGMHDEDSEDSSFDANERKAIKLISRIATIVAAIGRIRKGLQPIKPKYDTTHAGNFYWMLHGKDPDAESEKVLDVLSILHIDHECNASTFTSVTTISSLTDIYSAVVAAIGSLKGPLHGGANEQVVKTLRDIGKPENAEKYIQNALKRKEKIMGFGHRVYKSYDPRAAILKKYGEKLVKRAGLEGWLEIAKIIEKYMIEKLGQKGIYPNVDFYSGIVMHSLGIETYLFTPMFALGRISGWVAHILEQLKDNRIFRPRFWYIGPLEASYISIEARE